MKQSILILTLALICAFSVRAVAATPAEQRTEIQKMQARVLHRLYRVQPRAEDQINQAAGYAVFSSADVAAIFFSGAYGHGISHNNENGKDIYMEMASAGVGLGLGVKDFRAVFIFDTPKALRNFTTMGLDLSGDADMTAKEGVKGKAVSGAVDVLPGVRVYQLTKAGLLVDAMLEGTKYWRDGALNGDVQRGSTRYHFNNQE